MFRWLGLATLVMSSVLSGAAAGPAAQTVPEGLAATADRVAADALARTGVPSA